MAQVEYSASDHELTGIPDGGFGPQAFCSCGWRTSPKESEWQAEATWQAHQCARLVTAPLLARTA